MYTYEQFIKKKDCSMDVNKFLMVMEHFNDVCMLMLRDE